MSPTAAQLLIEAANCGLHITGLEGWTQTRLAKTLQIRRETLNAIINRSPAAEPTDERPRMMEACQRLITFAAALSAKDDEVLKLPIDVGNLQSDDGQAYEHHRLRLHQLVEAAVESNQFTNALCRMGEFASSAVHAEPRFRLRMICNLVTANQRLLDKPASKDIPRAVLRANVGRLYRAERTARRTATDAAASQEQVAYVRGQVGYGLIFSGISLDQSRLIQRGGGRLFAAARVQPDASYGHWCNLLRAINDLLACQQKEAAEWAAKAITLATAQGAAGFTAAYASLLTRGEIIRLQGHWQKGSSRLIVARLLKRSTTPKPLTLARRAMMWIIGVMITPTFMAHAPKCLAGDGRDFKHDAAVPDAPHTLIPTPTPSTVTSPLPSKGTTPTVIVIRPADTGSLPVGAQVRHAQTRRPLGIYIDRDFESDTADLRVQVAAEKLDAAVVLSTLGDAIYGENINSYLRAGGFHRRAPIAVAPMQVTPAEQPKSEAAPPAVIRSNADLPPAEKAAKALEMAKNYLAMGNDEIGQQKLRLLVQQYPGTPSAREAAGLLPPSTGAKK